MRDVRELIEREQFPEALEALEPQWQADPDNLEAIFYFGQMAVPEKPLVGVLAFWRIVSQAPHRWEAWVNLGACYSNLGQYDKAEQALRKALKLNPDALTAMVQMATLGVHRSNPDQAIHWARKALRIDPESVQAHIDLALGSLMAGDYATGWDEWRWGMGRCEFRDILNYGVPEWDGRPGTVVVYGEQGLGDEILMAQALTSATKDATIIYDTHGKIAPLMRRSFACEVHGTRLSPDVPWLAGRKVDAAISLSGLQRLYRRNASDWDGKPYLTPDPERRIQWRALLDSLGGKRKVGIAWTGGRTPQERAVRDKPIEAIAPDDCTLVSLEYRDCTEAIERYRHATGRQVHDWPRANQTNNLDDQAALVAELDEVVCVPQTVAHLAGALGVPCTVHMPRTHHAFWGKGDRIPMYESVRIVREA